jgi:hypothetical protein
MGFPIIVSPNNRLLLQSFTGFSVVLRLNDCPRLAEGVENVRQSGNSLCCVIMEFNRPLADIALEDYPPQIPLAVMVPALGRFRDLAGNLDRLRHLNLRVYLPCDHPDNLSSLRILASVGIPCCADFRYGRNDWDALADLATYAVLEQAPHAPIEPFAFMAANYHPGHYLDWGRVIFDDPGHFLHLDEDGRVALSPAELVEKRFVASNLQEINSPAEFPPIRRRLRSWRHYFTDNHPCAFCAAWRICRGKFSAGLSDNAGCAVFFQEMLELVRQARALHLAREKRRIWQL